MTYINQPLLDTLPEARETPGIFASLITLDSNIDSLRAAEGLGNGQIGLAWRFLVNPQSLSFSRSAKYVEAGTPALNSQIMQWTGSTGRTMSISNLLLDTWYEGRSVKPLITGLERLMDARLDKGKFAPPVLSFVWGRRRFSPCVLTEIKIDEAGWLDGEPALAVAEMTLLEVNPLMVL